jgi:hypothetical protein
VGKTTLRLKIEQVISNDLRSGLEQDRGRIPVVGVEAIAPESGRFCWSDHFRRLLVAMNEPLLDCKRDEETLYVRPTRHSERNRPRPSFGMRSSRHCDSDDLPPS